MSRVHDALRRVEAGGEVGTSESADSELFAPAWQMPADRAKSGNQEDLDHLAFPAPLDPDVAIDRLSFSSKWREKVASGADGDPLLIEQFRRLAATLHHARRNNGLTSVMVTSAAAGDGKTLTAINLALVLAESYRYNILVVDADLRRPSIPTVLNLNQGAGLSEALRATTDQKLALVPLTPRLAVLPAGKPAANSIELLTSPRMRRIVEEAKKRFDWVILDAPPVVPATDARLLTDLVDGTLLVVAAAQTQLGQVQKAIDALGREQILGVVLNGVTGDALEGYYASYESDATR